MVDIESSIFYPDKTSFLREVREVLRDDGTFYYGALLFSWKVASLKNALNAGFEVEKEEDITANALLSLKLDSNEIVSFINKHYPWCKKSLN